MPASPPTGDFTYTGWLNLTNNGDENFLTITANDGSNEFRIYVGAGQIDIYLDNAAAISDAGSIPTGTWTQVAVTRSGSNVVLYLNGLQTATATNGNALNFAGCGIMYGADADSGCNGTRANFLAGSLDDLRIYNRALTADEVAALYAQRSNADAPAGYMVYDTRYSAMKYCNGTNWVHAGIGGYNPNAVNFDGTNDYLTRGADLTGNADSGKFTTSLWFKAFDNAANKELVTTANSRLTVRLTATEQVEVRAKNTGGTDVLVVTTTPTYNDGLWHHVLVSVDMASTATRGFYVDGAAPAVTWATYTAASAIDFTDTNYGIGATTAGATKFLGDVADLWVDNGAYIDLSQAANRAKFRSPAGLPMYLGADGSLPVGAAPEIFLSGNTSAWHTNKGAGGGFTLTGALDTASSQPADTLVAVAGGVTSGLVYHWKLDEKSGSSIAGSAGGVTGTWSDGTGNDVAQEAVTGRIGGGIAFDGSDDRISTGTLGTFASNMENGPRTFTMWVKTSSASPMSAMGVFNAGNTTALRIWVNQDQNDVNTQGSLSLFSRGAGGASDELRGGVSVNTGISDGNWHHYAVTMDIPNNTLGFFVDGVQYTTGYTDQEMPGITENFSVPLMIGATNNNGTAGQFFNGSLDDVRIYDRGLSAAEIQQLAKSGNPGEMRYSNDYSVMEYSNGPEWTAMGPVGGTPPTSGLVSHWKFDETGDTNTAADSAGTNNGPLTNFPADESANWVAGQLGNSLEFDGTNDYINLGNPASLQLTGGMTISAWVYLDDFGSASRVISKNGSSSNRGWELNMENAVTNQIQFLIAENNSSVKAVYSGAVMPTGTWVHLVGLYEPSVAVRLYINAALIVSNTSGIPATQHNSTENVNIGKKPNAAIYWDGKLDDIRIYNRALTVQEISQLYYFGLSGGLGDVSGNCANPSKPEGAMMYNTDYNVMQYCNGEQWIGVGK